ncbi:unnamed protein product [Phaeothamnion confervicola]
MRKVSSYFSRIGAGISKRWGLDSDGGNTSPTSADLTPPNNSTMRACQPPLAAVVLTVHQGIDKEVEKHHGQPLAAQDCRSRVMEVLGFLGWVGLMAVGVAQIPMLWYVFWEYIGNYGEREDGVVHLARHRALPLWVAWAVGLSYYRGEFRRRAPPMIFDLFTHGEIFITVGLMMTLTVNFASMVHVPGPRLFDVGFMVIPEQAKESPWRPVSDILTAALPGIALVRSLWLDRKTRCKVVCDWFRLISIVYLFRCLTVALTSLPGPAPHCESYEGYHPPAGWHDIATRLGPMMGDFKTCGDLIFSGHTAWTTVTMLLAVKSFRETRYYRLVKLAGMLYLMTMCLLAIAGRKHYTVDVTLGILIASLTFFRFQDGWHWHLPPHLAAAANSNGVDDSAGNGGAYAYYPTGSRKGSTAIALAPAPVSHCGSSISMV